MSSRKAFRASLIKIFANTHGGRIFLGVDDHGKIVGEKLTNALKAKINSLARNCEPGIVLQSIEQVDKAVVITIDESDEKPERIGSGIPRIMDLMADAQLAKPVIESNAFFSITFERDPKFKVGGLVTEESIRTKVELSSRQASILRVLKNKRLSPREILDVLEEDVSDRTLRRDLQALKEKGYVDNEGQLGPKTKWFLLKPGH